MRKKIAFEKENNWSVFCNSRFFLFMIGDSIYDTQYLILMIFINYFLSIMAIKHSKEENWWKVCHFYVELKEVFVK